MFNNIGDKKQLNTIFKVENTNNCINIPGDASEEEYTKKSNLEKGYNYAVYTWLDSEHDVSFDSIPNCDNAISDRDFSGCCSKLHTIPDGVQHDDDCPSGHYTFLDVSYNGNYYNICNASPQTESLLKNLANRKPGLVKFILYSLIAIMILLVITIVGCSYQFWFNYGSSIDCLYFQSRCDNRGEKGDKATLNEIAFPDSLLYFPYQPCLPCSRYPTTKTNKSESNIYGGTFKVGNQKKEEFVGRYKEYYIEDKKCITLDDEEIENCVRPFPYNLPDIANNIGSPYIKLLLKMIAFSFIIPLLLFRRIFAFIFSKLSLSYQKNIKPNKYANTFTFLVLSGLIGPILALTGSTDLGLHFFSPYTFISLIFIFCGLINPIILIISIIFVLLPSKLIRILAKKTDKMQTDDDTFYKYFPHGNKENTIKYYQLFSSDLFYPIQAVIIDKYEKYHGKKIRTIAMNILCNLILFFLFLITLSIGLTFAGISCGLAYIYFLISTIIKLFYYPLTNSIEFYDIMKSHSNTLTLIFCVLVFVAASQSLHVKTRGFMGAALAVIFAIKIYYSFKD